MGHLPCLCITPRVGEILQFWYSDPKIVTIIAVHYGIIPTLSLILSLFFKKLSQKVMNNPKLALSFVHVGISTLKKSHKLAENHCKNHSINAGSHIATKVQKILGIPKSNMTLLLQTIAETDSPRKMLSNGRLSVI